MDMQLLESLADAPGLLLSSSDENDSDPFRASDLSVAGDPSSPDAYLFLSPDPFLPEPSLTPETSLSTDVANASAATSTIPKSELVLHPFDTPAIPLANSVPHVPHHPVTTPAPQIPPGSPLQENRASTHNVASTVTTNRTPGKVCAGVKKASAKVKSAPIKRQQSVGGMGIVKKESTVVDESARQRDKLAQRKLRNKESARRYREKQVARRRQLENYTRSLTEQNRELENLHDRLLTLTCERRMRGLAQGGVHAPEGMPGNVM